MISCTLSKIPYRQLTYIKQPTPFHSQPQYLPTVMSANHTSESSQLTAAELESLVLALEGSFYEIAASFVLWGEP